VAEFGTVETREFMRIERGSRAMRLVSTVRGWIRPDVGPLDIVRACFPAGAVTGAPRRRAMEIVEDLEGVRRGLYGGAVGHFDYHGNLDLCSATRTLVHQSGTVHWGVGTGVGADSGPELEWEATLHGGRALWDAVQRAEQGL
jgi:anthranilate synthase component 1